MTISVVTVEAARAFAVERHEAAGCTYGQHPFEYHLDAVAQVLKQFGHHDTAMHMVAYLHDVVEDTQTTFEEIEEAFGLLIRIGVVLLTDKPGRNRRERQAATYDYFVAALEEGLYGVHGNALEHFLNVKLADRIANFNASAGINSHHFSMYVSEHPSFCRALGRYGDERMWAALDKLARLNPYQGPARKVLNAIDELERVAPTISDQFRYAAPQVFEAVRDLRAAEEFMKKKAK